MDRDTAKPKNDKVELKLGDGGYTSAPDPRLAGPPLQGDRKRKAERLCMNAKHLEVVTDGTTGATSIVVDGVPLGGLIRFEMVVQKGFPRVSAVVEQTYVHESIKEYGENAGKDVTTGEANLPATVTIDVFKRV